MQFGYLGAFWWALLALPIVIFYILKIRLRRVPVSTVMFWQQIFEEKRPRSIWQQLRHLLSLLLQLAFLALVVFALADPYLPWEILQARRVVLVVDTSAGMRATDVLPDRLSRAKQDGERLIDGLRQRDEMAIVSAGSVPRVAMGLTSHQRTLRRALESLPATDARGSVPDAVELARRLLAGHKNGSVIVLTDGCFAEAAELEQAEDVELALVGEKTGNVGITQFQVRRSLIDPIGFQILVEVSNFSDEPRKRRLDIDLGERVVDVVPLQLEAGQTWSRVIDQTTAEGGQLVARLDVKDALESDNRAVALLPKREQQKVVLFTEGNLFLQKVFESIPVVDLTVADNFAAAVPDGAVAVYHKKVPDRLPSGNILVIDPQQSSSLWTVGEKIESPLVVRQDSDSPLMSHVQLTNVTMPDARRLEFTAEPEVLAASLTEEPLYAALEDDQRRVLLLTVDLDKGDLPLRTAFPIMMTNAVSWFQGEKGELREAVPTGRIVEVELAGSVVDLLRKSTSPLAEQVDDSPRGAQPALVLRSPAGEASPLPPGVEQTHIGPLDRCGVWTVEPAAEDEQERAQPVLEIACNLASREESDLRRADEIEPTLQAGFGGIGGRPIWFYLTMAAFALIATEWYLYQRRWIT